MAQIFGGISDVVNTLAPGKTVKNYLSDELQGQINTTTAGLDSFRTGQNADLDRILAGVAGAQPTIAQVGKDDLASLGTLINQGKNATAFDLAQQYGNYSTGLLDKVAGNLAGYGKSADNRSLAALGYGGRGGSTYQTNTILDRLSKNLAPAYAGVIQGIPGAVSGMISGDATRAGTIGNLVNQRAGIPLRGVYADMIPGQVRSQNLQDQIAALSVLGGAYKQNYLGSTYTPSKLGGVASGLAKTADSALDTYMSLYTGGMVGGEGGFMGGILGQPQKKATTADPNMGVPGTAYTPANFPPNPYANYFVSPWGTTGPSFGASVPAPSVRY